jgi:hypothetical protein
MKATRAAGCETALTEKASYVKKPNDRFLALRGGDGELHGSLFNIEDRVTTIPNGKDDLLLVKENLFVFPEGAEKRNEIGSRSEHGSLSRCQYTI